MPAGSGINDTGQTETSISQLYTSNYRSLGASFI